MKRILISIVLFGCVVSCGPNQRILQSANENSSEPAAASSNTAPVKSSFEQDLNAMRTADFKFIIVFRRKDGRPLDAVDKELISRGASQANRRLLSDEGQAVIIGSNFPFITGAFDAVTERLTIENFSKPDSGPMFSNAPAGEQGTNGRR